MMSAALPPADHVYALFAQQAHATPDAVAVIDHGGETTYRELARRAEAIARRLVQSNLAPEQPVGVLMERRADLLAALLGVWKAGGAYVPLDPKDPSERLSRILAASQCGIVLGDPSCFDDLAGEKVDGSPDAERRWISLADIPLLRDDVDEVAFSPDGARLAYILFTSGSTGSPKAVEIEHRNAAELLRSAQALLGFDSSDRYLAASTIAFDSSITELFLPLVTGASLLLRDQGILLDPAALAQDVREFGVTLLQTGPSVWAVILSAIPDFPRLRIAITHGEAVSPPLARRLCAYADEAWNLYGPTETTVWATGFKLAPDLALDPSEFSAPIGHPLAHLVARVVNEAGVEVEDGAPGELVLAGASVARGYRNAADNTEHRFSVIDGMRAYHTGDVVFRDGQGVLHYLGRNDEQMKVRGIRVEPGEIEAAALRHPAVAQAAVTWYPTPSGSRAIVAAIVMKQGRKASVDELRHHLSTFLPRGMMPTRFMFVPWLPVTLGGKIDRSAVRSAATAVEDDAASDQGEVAPGRVLSPTEDRIAAIWRRMLRLETVAADDHFFSIGGDSLSAVEMMIEVESAFGGRLPVNLAFEAPTLEALARRIEKANKERSVDICDDYVFHLAGDGDAPPLFFVSVDFSLARRGLWTLPYALYAVAYLAAGSGFMKVDTLEALAASYIERIRRIQPKGPYRLAGYSMGGLIALEMAQQLRATGDEVELLFLLDPMLPTGEPVRSAAVAESSSGRSGLRTVAASRGQRILKGPAAEGWGRWLSLFAPLPLPLSRLMPEWLISQGGRTNHVLTNWHLRQPSALSGLLFPKDRWAGIRFASKPLVRAYRPRPYEGHVFAAFVDDGRRLAWHALVPQAEVQALPMGHLDLFKAPVMDQWAPRLAACLQRGPRPLSRT